MLFSSSLRRLQGTRKASSRGRRAPGPKRRSRPPVVEELEPRLTPTAVGVNDFRISFMGPDGNPNFDASNPAMVYNSRNNEYLVVWSGDNTAPWANPEYEIFGQRIASGNGALRFGQDGGNEFENLGQPLAELDPPPPPPPPPILATAFRGKGVAKVRVTDAATGELRGVLTPFQGFRGRLHLQLEDVNGDGVLDLVVRALVHGKRKQRVFDAVTLAPLPPGLA